MNQYMGFVMYMDSCTAQLSNTVTAGPSVRAGRYLALTDYLAEPVKMNVLEKADALVILASEPVASE